jgi:hypothetical protein
MATLEDDDTAPDATSLCFGCGMCCDGSLFECLELEPDERLRFPVRSLVVLDGNVVAPLPCTQHRDRRCVIYEHRPSRCRAFRCKLYEEVNDGVRTKAEAVLEIEQTRRLLNTIETELGWRPGSFSTSRFRKWAAEFEGGEAAARRAYPKAFLDYGRSRLLMTRHFQRG